MRCYLSLHLSQSDPCLRDGGNAIPKCSYELSCQDVNPLLISPGSSTKETSLGTCCSDECAEFDGCYRYNSQKAAVVDNCGCLGCYEVSSFLLQLKGSWGEQLWLSQLLRGQQLAAAAIRQLR